MIFTRTEKVLNLKALPWKMMKPWTPNTLIIALNVVGIQQLRMLKEIAT
jgi:hypothetical protein